jgi:hypothetical protein
MHLSTSNFLRDPLGYFRAIPQSAICWRGLQGLLEFLLSLFIE